MGLEYGEKPKDEKNQFFLMFNNGIMEYVCPNTRVGSVKIPLGTCAELKSTFWFSYGTLSYSKHVYVYKKLDS